MTIQFEITEEQMQEFLRDMQLKRRKKIFHPDMDTSPVDFFAMKVAMQFPEKCHVAVFVDDVLKDILAEEPGVRIVQ